MDRDSFSFTLRALLQTSSYLNCRANTHLQGESVTKLKTAPSHTAETKPSLAPTASRLPSTWFWLLPQVNSILQIAFQNLQAVSKYLIFHNSENIVSRNYTGSWVVVHLVKRLLPRTWIPPAGGRSFLSGEGLQMSYLSSYLPSPLSFSVLSSE